MMRFQVFLSLWSVIYRHGTITGFKVYQGLESHGIKTIRIFRYTVLPSPCGWCEAVSSRECHLCV